MQKMTSLQIEALQLHAENLEAISRLATSPNMIRLFCVTPEIITNSMRLQELLRGMYNNNDLGRFVIDEAHCISNWGYDFRQAYRNLNSLRCQYPDIPIMALSATVTDREHDEIERSLTMRDTIRVQCTAAACLISFGI